MTCEPCAHVSPKARASSTATLLSACMLLALPLRADELRVGLGSAPLPTPEGGVLAGYASFSDRRATGIWGQPEARAIVVDTPALRVGLVALDILIPRPALRESLGADGQELGLDLLVVVATHTHSGPGGYMPGFVPERVSMGSFRPGAVADLRRAALRALAGAVSDLAPARVSSGIARAQLSANRRSADGGRETALPLLRFDFAARAPIVLFAYGTHPVVLPPSSLWYSADFPGRSRAWLEERGWRALFVPGPLGDQAPTSSLGPLWPDTLEAQRAQANEIGAALGRAVLAGLGELPPSGRAELQAVESVVQAPPSDLRRFCPLWWLGPLSRRALDRELSRSVPIVAVRVGRAVLLALPAEPVSALGDEIRAQVDPGLDAFVIAHANDWIGYAVTEQDYAAGSYEACMSFHGSGFGPWLVRAAGQTLRLLHSTP